MLPDLLQTKKREAISEKQLECQYDARNALDVGKLGNLYGGNAALQVNANSIL